MYKELMTRLMPNGKLVHKALAVAVLFCGLLPIFYFASGQFEITQALAEEDTADSVYNVFDRYIENVAFGVGERLSFDINYGFINAGTATMEVVRLIEYGGRPCYQVVTRANSNSFFSTFYANDGSIFDL